MPSRKISRPPLEFLDIIYKVAKIVNISDIQFAIGYGSDDEMDSILGDVHKVIISGYRDGQVIKREFVIKWIAEPEKRAAFRKLYERDYAFNNFVLPKLIEIQRQFNIIEGLKITLPNCIFSSIEPNKECLVFNYILNQGYVINDRFFALDVDHCSLVIKTLAKMHALFYVLQHKDIKHSDLVKTLYQADVQYSDPKSITKCIIKFYNKSVDVVKDPAAKEKLTNCTKYIYTILSKCIKSDRYSTICHADCWNNNIMFKYQGKKPVDVVLVDYQMSRYSSPVTDLSYFLYMSADQEFLENHYERLITLYYITLSAVLRQCNLHVNDIYPEEIFKDHLKKYSVLGLIEALISMKIITAVSVEAVEMAKMRYEITDNVIYEGESQNESLFVKRINGVVNHFFQSGYSLDAVLEK